MPGMGGGLPPRKALVPSVKMRVFHWITIPAIKIPTTFWNNHVDEDDKDIDVELLEDKFKAAETKVLKKKKATAIKTLLDSKRGQNLGIFKSGFKIPMYELERRLSVMPPSTDALPIEHIQNLRKLGPTPEEREAYDRYKGDKTQLSDIDQFIMKLMEIPLLKMRLDLLMMVHDLPLQFDELLPAIDLSVDAVNEVLNSKRLEQVMLYGLSIGNHVNGGTKKGGQHGIALKSFPKFADTKGSDKKTTLMDFLYITLRKRKRQDGDIAKFTDDLKNAVNASDSSVKALEAEVEMLAKDLMKIDRASEALKRKTPKELITPEQEKFFGNVEKFVTMFEENLVDMHEKVNGIVTNYADLLKKFGEKPNTDSEEVFGHVTSFVQHFKEAVQKYKDAKEREKKDKKKKALEAKKEAKKLAKKNGAGAEVSPPAETERKERRKKKQSSSKGEGGSKNPFGQAKTQAPGPETAAVNPFGQSAEAKKQFKDVQAAKKRASSITEPKNPFAKADALRDAGVPIAEEAPLEEPTPTRTSSSSPKNPFDPVSPTGAKNPFGPVSPTPEAEADGADGFAGGDVKTTAASVPAPDDGAGSRVEAAASPISPVVEAATPPASSLAPPVSLGGGGGDFVKSGILLKAAKSKYNKRLFMLTNDGFLNYKKKKADEANAGSISLGSCTAWVDPEDDAALYVKQPDKQHHMKADDAAAAAAWVAALSQFTASS